ncbi:MAG: VOC family protein, partial [Solirubrobacteraceae bacterium]
LAFYETLGFERQAAWPSAAFVSAGGYHHHIGLNSWQSAGGPPAPADAPGLREIAFELSGPERVDDVTARAGERDGAAAGQPLTVRDPAGQPLTVRDPDGERLVFGARQAA